MSGFLKRGNKSVNPAGGVNPASSPNVGQYGWTSFDAGNVNQIIEYVNICKEYAERAKDSADYVESKFGELQSFIDYIEVIYEQIGPIFDNIDLLYKDIVIKHQEVLNAKAQAEQAMLTSVEASHEATKSATKSENEYVKAQDAAVRSHADALNSEASAVASEASRQAASEIAEELRKGQVYRGTWNIEANAGFPTAPDTNSVWDIVLNESSVSYDFNGETWFWGDRLLYLKDENKFSQIESGSGVISVNGKSGAVTLIANDVGALSLDGSNAMIGTLTTPSVTFRDNDGSINNNEGEVVVQSTKSFGATLFGTPTKNSYIVAKDNIHARLGGVDYKFYHEGFKPTAADVGALSTGGGILTSTLNIKAPSSHLRLTETDNADKQWHVEVSNGDFRLTETNVAQRFILKAGGGADLAGNLSVSGAVFSSVPPASINSLTRKDYVDEAVKVVSDKVDNIDLSGYMPKSGGVFTDRVSLNAGQKGALDVSDKASIMFRDGSGAWLHQEAVASSLRWGAGTNGDQEMMTLSLAGYLTTQGPQYARTAHVARNNDETGWIGIESPDEGAPYISSKTTAEPAVSIAMRFGKSEVSVESGKTMSANAFRVGGDGGMRFAPTSDFSGLSWGMGINPDSRTLGLYKYVDGAYAGQWMEFNNDSGIQLRAPTFTDGRLTIRQAQGLDITSNSHNIMQYHQPQSSAIITYKPVDRIAFRIAGSNGEFTETGMIADISGAIADFQGSVYSRGRTSRSWTQMGVANFVSNQQDVGEGTLTGTVTAVSHFPGRHILEYGYGTMNAANAEVGAHALWTNDGGTLNRIWLLHNNGQFNAPSGWHMAPDGNVYGGIYGTNYLTSWVQFNFAPLSDANHKTILGESKLSAVGQIGKMKFHEFVWKETDATKQVLKRGSKVNRIGVIAQEIEEIDPTYTRDVETFNEDGSVKDSVKTLDTANLLAVALKAIQEQQIQINELKEKLNEFILK